MRKPIVIFKMVSASNQGDYVKNIGFVMDQQGAWSLSPAYDITYSYNPTGAWTGQHQMSLNGKRDGFTLDDFRACAKSAVIKCGRAETIVKEVTGEFAVGVGEEMKGVARFLLFVLTALKSAVTRHTYCPVLSGAQAL